MFSSLKSLVLKFIRIYLFFYLLEVEILTRTMTEKWLQRYELKMFSCIFIGCCRYANLRIQFFFGKDLRIKRKKTQKLIY